MNNIDLAGFAETFWVQDLKVGRVLGSTELAEVRNAPRTATDSRPYLNEKEPTRRSAIPGTPSVCLAKKCAERLTPNKSRCFCFAVEVGFNINEKKKTGMD